MRSGFRRTQFSRAGAAHRFCWIVEEAAYPDKCRRPWSGADTVRFRRPSNWLRADGHCLLGCSWPSWESNLLGCRQARPSEVLRYRDGHHGLVRAESEPPRIRRWRRPAPALATKELLPARLAEMSEYLRDEFERVLACDRFSGRVSASGPSRRPRDLPLREPARLHLPVLLALPMLNASAETGFKRRTQFRSRFGENGRPKVPMA